jgi:hypothetical protein
MAVSSIRHFLFDICMIIFRLFEYWEWVHDQVTEVVVVEVVARYHFTRHHMWYAGAPSIISF